MINFRGAMMSMTDRRRRVLVTLAVLAAMAVGLYAATLARFGTMLGG